MVEEVVVIEVYSLEVDRVEKLAGLPEGTKVRGLGCQLLFPWESF